MPWELPDVMEAFLHWHLQMMEYLNKVVYATGCDLKGVQ
jgi:hypothetical protein